MVGPRPSTSEYRRSFKESFFRCSSRTYEDNLCYRTGRRQAEHDHNAEVFIWDTDSSDSASSCGDLPRPASLPTHKLKHQKLIESYAKRLNKTQDIQVNVPDKHSALAVNRSPECSPVKLKNGVDLNANKPKSGTQKVAVCSREQQTSGKLRCYSSMISDIIRDEQTSRLRPQLLMHYSSESGPKSSICGFSQIQNVSLRILNFFLTVYTT